MRPDGRREQLLDLGVRLLATRSLDKLSIEMLAEEAGISRGLLYHYFGNKQDFHRAVVRRAADDLIAHTAPSGEGRRWSGCWLARGVRRLRGGELPGYISLVRGAAGGNADIQEIYEEARAALTDRIFDRRTPGASTLTAGHPGRAADGARLERDGGGRGDRLGARRPRGVQGRPAGAARGGPGAVCPACPDR